MSMLKSCIVRQHGNEALRSIQWIKSQPEWTEWVYQKPLSFCMLNSGKQSKRII